MSQTNSEQSIVSAKANVMIYDDVSKKWNPSGAAPGLSKVQIYQHLLNQTYRVVGRKIQDHEVVINCSLQKNLKYNQANQTFLQWRDSKQVYGLHFQCKDEADVFTQTLKMAVDNLNRLAISSSSSASSTSSSNAGGGGGGGNGCGGGCGDNISIGKRSVASAGSSSDYSQSIYDDNENLNINRPNFNVMNGTNVNGVINGMIGHHQTSLNAMYNANVQTRMQPLNSAPALSVSSSSGPSNGSLTISVSNPTNQNGYTNGYNYIHQQQQQQQQQQIMQQQSAPLYQSSPIPPPPPPPLPLNINLLPTNNQSNENYNSPKIYDTIPDTGVSYPNQCASSSAPPPPAPPLPTSIFSASSAPPPPAPPPPSVPSCHQPAPSQPSYISEIAKFQANKLKKVESEPNTAAKGNGPPGPLDFLAEIRQRIEKKNSMEKEHKNTPDNNIDTTSCKPSSLVSRNLNGKNQFAGVVNGLKSQQFESPKTIKKITSTPNVATNGNGTNGVYSSDSINYDKLKQELIVEFRKELQTFKQDIAPQQKDILFFNENGFVQPITNGIQIKSSLKTNSNGSKKQVKFPDDDRIIKDYSEAPKPGWVPGKYSTNDLLESYLKSCDRHKTRPLNRLIPQLKALQEIECTNGEKVNVLNLKNEKLDSKQMESIEEIFKRLSFKTIDLESSQFEDDTTGAILFEILDYYDTCERLILSNVKGFGLFGWQELSKYIKKSASVETIELRHLIFTELIYFTYLARSFRFAQSLKVVHLENSNINSRFLSILSTALRDNEKIKELYLCDNKIQPQDGHSIASIIKENKYLELIDLKNNNLQDAGLAKICTSLSERSDVNSTKSGLKSLCVANNSITTMGCTYLCKALIHNCTLTNLNISNNSLTNESIFELKDALIVNKKIECLILNKVRITDEGVIALAEYIAETRVLKRLDLRENDIRLGGLMALASSIKFNSTVDRIDLDREPKKENSIKDSIETSKRLIQDINECCLNNRRERERYESLQKSSQQVDEDDDYVKLQDSNELCKSPSTENNSSTSSVNLSGEEDIDIIAKDDELLRKILNRTYHTNSPNLLSPIHPNEDIINLFNIENGNIDDQAEQNKIESIEEFQFIEQDLSLNPADFEKIICKSTPLNFNQNSSNQANLCKKRLDFELVEVNDLINELIEKIERQLDLDSYLLDTSSKYLPTNAEFPTPESTPESTPPVLKQNHREPLFASQLTKSQLSEELSNQILL